MDGAGNRVLCINRKPYVRAAVNGVVVQLFMVTVCPACGQALQHQMQSVSAMPGVAPPSIRIPSVFTCTQCNAVVDLAWTIEDWPAEAASPAPPSSAGPEGHGAA